MTTIVVVASGPSLRASDVAYCRGKADVIVVNDCYRMAPWARIIFAADYRWWGMHYSDVVDHCRAERWTCDADAARDFDIHHIGIIDAPGLCRDSSAVHFGENSGYQAVNLAYHMGATRIVLLGFDMGATGNSHWFGDHPASIAGLDAMKTLAWPRWCAHFDQLAADLKHDGIEVINATRETNLTCFERAPIEDAL